jgi:PPK2 family polyphosphate:nucleotide phosphotransferase
MPYAKIVKPGDRPNLSKTETAADGGLRREEGEELADKLGNELTDLQELLYAAGKTALLIVLQGMDTSGKDGTIRHLLNYMNAQGTRIAPFKVPTPKELAHDYLWRCHQETPGRGETVIFNRSHYEDVLVVRVHELVPEQVWKLRYGHINDFERLLTDNGATVVKFFLHISKEEQEKRLREREIETEKAWKLSVGDWKERELWHQYQAAYEDALAKCSTEAAPWHIVPADHKWYRNLAITQTLVETLRPMREGWMDKLRSIGEQAKADLAAYRAGAKG